VVSKDDILSLIKSNAHLIGIIESSEFVKAKYKPRSYRRSEAGLAMRHFWQSIDGARFRVSFEKCVGGERALGLLRGAAAKVKLAVFTIIIEYRHREGIDR